VIADDNFEELLFKVGVRLSETGVHRIIELKSVSILISNSNIAILNDG